MRSIAATLVLCVAVLWTPVWFQFVLFVLAILLLPKKLLFLLPAVISDWIYAPVENLTFGTLKMTLIVGSMIAVWLLIIHQTRISHVVPTN